jgi:hypothetical protein
MAIQSSGEIKFSQLAQEFGISPPFSLSQFYRGAGNVPVSSTNVSVPPAGEIKISNLFATSTNPSVVGPSVVLNVSGWGQTVANGGTITGPAPLSIWTDTVSTVHENPAIDTFRQMGYHFDFGYATPTTPGSWAYSGKPKGNQIGAPVAAHVYETPGTYTLSVRAQDSLGATSDQSVTIVVENSETYWSTGGRTTTTLVRSSTTVWPTFASNTRYLLEAGEDYSALGRLNIINIQNVCIAKTGAGANPVLDDLSFDRTTGASVPTTTARVQFMNLDTQQCHANVGGTDCLFYKCNPTNVLVGDLLRSRYTAYPNQVWQRSRRVCYYECSINCSNVDYPFITQTYEFMFMGCLSENPGEHSLRVQGAQYGFIAHNKLIDANSDKHFFTIRATGYGDLSPVMSSPSNEMPASRYVVAADNILGEAGNVDAVDWPMYVGPQNSGASESLEFILVERNVFGDIGASHTTSVYISSRGCRNITLRDDTYLSGDTVGVSFSENFGVIDPAWANGPVYSNRWISGPDNIYEFTTPTAILPSKAT